MTSYIINGKRVAFGSVKSFNRAYEDDLTVKQLKAIKATEQTHYIKPETASKIVELVNHDIGLDATDWTINALQSGCLLARPKD